jgi:taurine--2-oxoglutarate transaminase
MAKGITSGYVPLGAVLVSDKIAAHFENTTLWIGLTYNAHALACAAAIAAIKAYKEEAIFENVHKMGVLLENGLKELAVKHPCLGDIRGTGLFYVIELVKNRESREPMCGFNQPLTEPMKKVAASLEKNGLSTFVRWNWIFNTPPLTINAAQISEGLEIVDKALDEADPYYEG